MCTVERGGQADCAVRRGFEHVMYTYKDSQGAADWGVMLEI